MTNIVLLVRDRFKLTEQAIRSLYDHTPQDQFNLTIVDDESMDFRVTKMLRAYWPNTAVVSINNSTHILASLKNLGVYWSEQRFGRGEWLCLCDNDVYFKPGWLEVMEDRAKYSEPLGFRLWGGQAHPFHQPLTDEGGDLLSEGLTRHDCLAGTHWFMRWDTWDLVGPLKGNAPGVCQSEDYAWTQQLRVRGIAVPPKYPEDAHIVCRFGPAYIGVVHPHVVIDCGITNSDGQPAPGADLKLANRVAGVYYE